MNLRKLFISLSLLAIPFISFAQKSSSANVQEAGYRNSIEIAYNPGALSISKLSVTSKLQDLDAAVPYADIYTGYQVEGVHSTGTFSTAYLRKINKWLWLGGCLAFENMKLDLRDIYSGEADCSYLNCLPVMAMGKAAWLRREHVSLYSKLGLGATPIFAEGSVKKVKVAFQISLIGFEFGGNHVFGFVEAGLGLQGVVLAGMRFPF